MQKSSRWKQKRTIRKQHKREQKRRAQSKNVPMREPNPSSSKKIDSTPSEWCESLVNQLLVTYSRSRKKGLTPVLFALVKGDDGITHQMRMPLEDTAGAEVLRPEMHPFPASLASIFARGYYGDFLAVHKIGEHVDFRLVECSGQGVAKFPGRQPTIADFEGPLESDERILDGDARRRAVKIARARTRIRGEGTCLFTDVGGRCGKPAIESHSVGRAAHLKRIAKDNHVKCYAHDWLRRMLGSNERVGDAGINVASTFKGFCAEHDAKIFAAIDRSPIELTQRNAELLGYRAQAYEVFVQWVSMRLLHEHAGAPSPEELARDYDILRAPVRRLALGWRDGLEEKRTWDAIIAGQNADRKVRFHFIRLLDPPEVLAAAYVCPNVDFVDQPLQELDAPTRAEYIAVSILQDGDTGLIAFVWLEGPLRVGERLISSLRNLPAASRMDAAVRWLFNFAENIFWSPEWWDGLSPAARHELEHLMDSGVVPWVTPLNQANLVDWQIKEEIRGWK